MAVSRVQKSSVLQGFPKSRSLLAGNSAYIPTSFESIATVTPTTASFSFTSIPSTYKHLQIRAIARGGTDFSTTAGWLVTFNNDNSSSYSLHRLYGNGSSVIANGSASQTYIQGEATTNGTAMAANTYAATILDILDYASTSKNKTVRCFSGGDDNNGTTGSRICLSSGLWMSTSAISTIKIDTGYLAFSSGTTFALYGIKG